MNLKFTHWIMLIPMITIGLLFIAGFDSYEQDKTTTLTNTAMDQEAKNVLGGALASCCTEPMTGFYRNGFCQTGPTDYGTHVVCAVMTQAFLDFTKARGNDLCTARPEYRFPGLKAGDKWCLCAVRWKEAFDAGYAPKVVLESTHEKALQFMTLEELKSMQFGC